MRIGMARVMMERETVNVLLPHGRAQFCFLLFCHGVPCCASAPCDILILRTMPWIRQLARLLVGLQQRQGSQWLMHVACVSCWHGKPCLSCSRTCGHSFASSFSAMESRRHTPALCDIVNLGQCPGQGTLAPGESVRSRGSQWLVDVHVAINGTCERLEKWHGKPCLSCSRMCGHSFTCLFSTMGSAGPVSSFVLHHEF
jgi:hypothetical protein